MSSQRVRQTKTISAAAYYLLSERGQVLATIVDDMTRSFEAYGGTPVRIVVTVEGVSDEGESDE